MWFRLDKKNENGDVVEYSTDFKFFTENQLRIIKSGKNYSFCSRLESKCFLKTVAYNRTGELYEVDIQHHTHLIHKEILEGKHGAGVLLKFKECDNCINSYDDIQMCRFCVNGSHQTLGQ